MNYISFSFCGLGGAPACGVGSLGGGWGWTDKKMEKKRLNIGGCRGPEGSARTRRAPHLPRVTLPGQSYTPGELHSRYRVGTELNRILSEFVYKL